jgi:hypothetical protein
MEKHKILFNKYVNLLSPFFELEIGDKISWFQEKEGNTIDDILTANVYINKPTYFNSIYRWYYSQSRSQTLHNLSVIKFNYSKLMDDIYFEYERHGNKIVKEVLEFNEKLMLGLFRFKETYKTDDRISEVIDRFIQIIFVFRENIQSLNS